MLNRVNPEGGPNFTDAYIDDVLVSSQTAEDHVEHRCAVLDRLRKGTLSLCMSVH